jgi:hypothetical protein
VHESSGPQEALRSDDSLGHAARTAVSRATLIVATVAALLATLVALRMRPVTLYDDAAITFRYASRLADGAGFTFNDGDRTNGASAPLYTLVLAAAARVGLRPETTAAAASVPLFGLATGSAALLAGRIAGAVAAATAAAVLVSSEVFQNQMLSGMEAGLAITLGLAALVALSAGRTLLAAAVAGLAVVNRLDGAGLALALLIGVAATRRQVPWREGAVVAGVALPWFVFSTAYFGSPLPHSMTQKLAGRSGTWDQDPTWVLRTITGRHGALVLLLAVASALVLRSTLGAGRWPAAAHLAALVWLAVHVAAYSLADLGAPYPWYVTAAIPPAAIGAGVSVGHLVDRARAADRRAGWVALAASTLLALAVSLWPGVRWSARSLVDPPPERTARLLDATREQAGELVAAQAAPGDVVRTCFGWVGYRASELRVDEVCPLSTREPVPAPEWIVESPEPGTETPVPEGFEQVARIERTGPDGVEVHATVLRRT